VLIEVLVVAHQSTIVLILAANFRLATFLKGGPENKKYCSEKETNKINVFRGFRRPTLLPDTLYVERYYHLKTLAQTK